MRRNVFLAAAWLAVGWAVVLFAVWFGARRCFFFLAARLGGSWRFLLFAVRLGVRAGDCLVAGWFDGRGGLWIAAAFSWAHLNELGLSGWVDLQKGHLRKSACSNMRKAHILLTPGGPVGLRIVRPEPMKMSIREIEGWGDVERAISIVYLLV